jgi:uncharacterized membrane protein YoaK (UPF0700 family)
LRVSQQAFHVPKYVAAMLAFAAGTVDVCTFLGLFGLFVAQVTGSFVVVGAQVVKDDPRWPIHILAFPVFFAAGVVTTFLAALGGKLRWALFWTLVAELALIGGFAVAGVSGWPFAQPNARHAVITGVLGIAAMGVQSAWVRLLLKGHASTNVMTTNTSVMALDVAQWAGAAWRARRRPGDADAAAMHAQAKASATALWPVFAGFFVGVVFGAAAFNAIGFWTALLPFVTIATVLIWAVRTAPRE